MAERTELITRPEAARRIGLGVRQIRRACEKGEIPLYWIGGWPRINWPDVQVWIESQKTTDPGSGPSLRAARARSRRRGG